MMIEAPQCRGGMRWDGLAPERREVPGGAGIEALAGVSAAIEADLVARAMAAVKADEEIALAPLDFNETMRLLAYFKARDRGAKSGAKRRYATPEQTDAELHAALDAMAVRIRARKKREREARKAKGGGARGSI